MRLLAFLFLVLLGEPALAQTDYASRLTEADTVLRDFRFRSGETLPELRIHYATLGTPHRDAAGADRQCGDGAARHRRQRAASSSSRNSPTSFTGPASRSTSAATYIILPDNIGHGRSSKPSDGLRMRFPAYDYDDMVEAQRRMLVDGLGVTRLRLLMGTSMGCMHGFVWAETHPDFARAMMPMACLPVEIAGHNRMWRRAAVEGIRRDPAWQDGNYASQPVQGLRTAASLLQVAGFAPLYLQHAYPDRASAEDYIVERIERAIAEPRRQRPDLSARSLAQLQSRAAASSASACR